jgi:asparagine synthetase B (glutamine-hydrolysing)
VSPGGLLRLRRHRLQAALRRGICPRDPHLLAALEQRLLKAAEIEPVPGGRAYVGAIRSLTQAPLLLLEQDQSHAWAARLGFRLLLPYFDRDLMELSLRIHPEHLVSGGRSKPLLRRLVAERLPSVPMRAKKVDFTRPFDAVLRRGGRRAWEALGGPSMLADLGIVGPDGLERWMNDYFEGGNTDSLRAWLVLSTEAWLRARSGSGSRPAQRG